MSERRERASMKGKIKGWRKRRFFKGLRLAVGARELRMRAKCKSRIGLLKVRVGVWRNYSLHKEIDCRLIPQSVIL
jgi:hypothetical protein